ncbi:MAG: hypothetical protein ABSA62_10620 [Methyloceanibacter sp.]
MAAKSRTPRFYRAPPQPETVRAVAPTARPVTRIAAAPAFTVVLAVRLAVPTAAPATAPAEQALSDNSSKTPRERG